MGRDAGFIAAGAALISQEANFVLMPEVPFPLDGERRIAGGTRTPLAPAQSRADRRRRRGRPASLRRLAQAQGCVGQSRFMRISACSCATASNSTSPNARSPISLKYLDPSYLIRSIPANAWDMFLSDQMARHAVHAAMAGKTDVLIGSWYSHFVHLPIRSDRRPTQDGRSGRHAVDRRAGRDRATALVTESDVRRPSATRGRISPRSGRRRHLPRNSRVLSAQLGRAKSSGRRTSGNLPVASTSQISCASASGDGDRSTCRSRGPLPGESECR